MDNGIEFIVENLFKLIDDETVERILKIILISNDMNDNDKQMIELLIQNDKDFHFIRIKYIFISQFIINCGYFLDKIDDQVILKISGTLFSNVSRKQLSKIMIKNENITILNLKKTFFREFNKRFRNIILKNVENQNHYDMLMIKSIYLDNYNHILSLFESYTYLLEKFFDFFTDVFLILFKPLFFENRYGIGRNTFNITFIIIFAFFQFFTFFKNIYSSDRNDNNNVKEYKLKNDIIHFFENMNTIIEKNTIKMELSNILKTLTELLQNEDFIRRYKFYKIKNKFINHIIKYKKILTLSSLVINDSVLFNLLTPIQAELFNVQDAYTGLRKKLPFTRNFIDVLNIKPYYTEKTISWNYDSQYEYMFVLENVTIEYKENDIVHKILENVSLNFEISKLHFIYGNSGSGKTSLLNAIMKRIKIKEGSIKFLNLYDNYTYFSIRKYLVLLLSESALFSNSLYYNITYGINNKILIEKNDEIMQEIVKYMNLFGLTKFIKYVKIKNATKLSKGQTQRIAIIRLFINIIFNDARILFLDEFTSNIDNSMEEVIFKELIKL